MEITFTRRRNLQTPTGEAFKEAFTQTEILERGWTLSMIRRHLGPPNTVARIGAYDAYQFDRRRVYAAEGSPALQMDLLALEDIRLIGHRWLSKYTAYIPAMMRAVLEGRADLADTDQEAAVLRKMAANLPPQKTPRTAPLTPGPVPAPPKPAKAPPAPAPAVPLGHFAGTQGGTLPPPPPKPVQNQSDASNQTHSGGANV